MDSLNTEAALHHVAAQLLVKAQTERQHEALHLQAVAAELVEQASQVQPHGA